MKSLRVTCRGEARTIALENQGVLLAMVTCTEGCKPDPAESNELSLTGLDSRTNSHLAWDKLDLESGDTVVIEIIEDCVGDPPDEIKPGNAEQELESKRQYVRETAKELGWSIVED